MSFQLTALVQFSTREFTIIYVIVDSWALNWKILINWTNMEEHTQFQLVTNFKKIRNSLTQALVFHEGKDGHIPHRPP